MLAPSLHECCQIRMGHGGQFRIWLTKKQAIHPPAVPAQCDWAKGLKVSQYGVRIFNSFKNQYDKKFAQCSIRFIWGKYRLVPQFKQMSDSLTRQYKKYNSAIESKEDEAFKSQAIRVRARQALAWNPLNLNPARKNNWRDEKDGDFLYTNIIGLSNLLSSSTTNKQEENKYELSVSQPRCADA